MIRLKWRSKPVYEASLINHRGSRKRRTNAEITDYKAQMVALIFEHQPVTLRQAFYLGSAAGYHQKTEQAYGRLGRILVQMRREGELPWGWIVDGTRMRRRPRAYSSAQEAIDNAAEFYRKDLLRELPVTIEIWTEKDAITGTIYPPTSEFTVSLMSCRGYPSVTFLHESAEELTEEGKPAFIYYLGDLDPSGVDITRHVEKELRAYAEVPIEFTKLAVTREQVETLGLPTRPTKKSDSRSKRFVGRSVDVDAIPPKVLRELVRGAIEQHFPMGLLKALRRTEQLERETLEQVAANMPTQVH